MIYDPVICFRMFFDACDGIFLNYVWTVDGLQASAHHAGDRAYDVYVGADVFGRGCPGGGGFNTVEVRDSMELSVRASHEQL